MHHIIWHVMNIPSEKTNDISCYHNISYEIIIISVPVLGYFQPEKKTQGPASNLHTLPGDDITSRKHQLSYPSWVQKHRLRLRQKIMWYSERNSGKSYKSASGFLTSWCVWKWFGYEIIGKMMTNQKKFPTIFRQPIETTDWACHTRNYSMMALVLCLAPSLKMTIRTHQKKYCQTCFWENNLTNSGKYFVHGIMIEQFRSTSSSL